jgi:hypothetical protein
MPGNTGFHPLCIMPFSAADYAVKELKKGTFDKVRLQA